MRKIQGHLLSILGIMFISLLLTVSYARAEVKEGNLFFNDEEQSVQISITYDHNDAKISIISPSGRVITSEEDSDDVAIFSTENSLYFIIEKAEKGQWLLKYDKGSNDSITASVDKFEDPIWITQFDIISIDNDSLTYEFLVEHTEDIDFSYTISLTTDNTGGVSKEIGRGYGKANSIVSSSIDISSINTYDSYYLQLNINYFKNDIEYFDIAYSEPFSYVSSKYVEPLGGIDSIVYPENGYININWANYIPYEAAQIYVTAEADGKEIYSSLFNPREYDECVIQYDEGTKSVEIGISVQNSYGQISDTFYRTIKIEKGDNDFQLSFPNQGLTNSYQWIFAYKNAVNQEIDITVNEKEQSIWLDGDGEKYLTLANEINNIIVSYDDKEGTSYQHQLITNVDSIPPQLKIFENLDGSTTSNDSVIITGRTDVGAMLTINDTAVEIDDDGLFIHSLPLVEGLNNIFIKAIDQVGNITSYTASVSRNDKAAKEVVSARANVEGKAPTTKKYYLWIILAMALIIVLLTVTLIIVIKKTKEKGILVRLSAVSFTFGIPATIIGACSIIYYLIRRRFEKSQQYVRLAYESVGDAYDYIMLTQRIKKISIIILIVGIALILLALAIMLVMKISKHIKESKEKRGDVVEDTSDLEVTSNELLNEELVSDETEIKYCSKCGAGNSLHDKFCGNCGAMLTE